MRGAALVGQEMPQLGRLIGRPVPHDVVAAVAGAQVVVGPGHRIAEELLAGWQAERHVFEQLAMDIAREDRLGNERAPGHIAGIERHQFGQALLADGGTDAIGRDQQIALGAAAVVEVRDHRATGLSEMRDAPPAMIMRRRKRVPQHAVDPLPGRQHLRAFEFADKTACRIEDLPGRDRDAEIGRIDAKAADAIDQVGLRHDAGAAAGQLALDALENIDGPAGPAQLERRQQAAHRAANHQSAPLRRCVQGPNPAVSKSTKVVIYRSKLGGMPWP